MYRCKNRYTLADIEKAKKDAFENEPRKENGYGEFKNKIMDWHEAEGFFHSYKE